MEQFFENIIKYSLNLAVDNVYESIQNELNQEQSLGNEVASAIVNKGYDFLKLEIQQL
ncbi:hypothetical protein VSN93_00575 [Acinetobacter johnsonii]|uniref:hypothetical protein n=1 Tax=Acinetobacter johnsonii TaxID=40214 RepID=UPI001CC91135|nr:hypothetical protein [Acinetobacter johnsonii]UBQ36628.1 hypothetical protein LCH18_10435 [Acinetobacter johnsonii]